MLKIFLLNIGVLIQLHNILFSGRVKAVENKDLIFNFFYFLYTVVYKTFINIKSTTYSIYIMVFIILLFVILIYNIVSNRNKIYIFIYFIISILIYCSSINSYTTNTILNSNILGGRYLFVPVSIMITLIISIYDNLIKTNKLKMIFCFKIFILLILINSFVNINNILIIRNQEWNELSKLYNKNGKYFIRINISPNGYIVNIPSNKKGE